MKIIDLRSDTVTQPTEQMRKAMYNAPLGDDVFEDDPSVNSLEHYAASLFGKEAALFCSSGTQTNQIAIKVHTRPGDELICDGYSHIFNYEGGGIAFNSGVQARLIHTEKGVFSPNDIKERINVDNVHFSRTSLICAENTVNKAGGTIWSKDALISISECAKANQLPLHLDGARLFNAIIESNYTTKDIGHYFDTISICLSKGLGAPVGSLLLGDKAFIKEARRIRKVFGGGMRQAGFLAAAGQFALEKNISRLAIDHQHCKQIASLLKDCTYISEILPHPTNLLIFKFKETSDTLRFIEHFSKAGIKLVGSGPNTIRFAFHLDVDAADLTRIENALRSFS
jgi:threonine aldolase